MAQSAIFLILGVSSLYPFANGADLIGDLGNVLQGGSTANIFITLSSGPEEILTKLARQTFGSRMDRVESVVEGLKNHSTSTQKTVIEMLEKFASVSPTPIKITPFWISNQIYVQGANKFLVALLQALGPLISFIGEERFAKLIPIIPATSVKPTATNSNATWGIQKIGAEETWALLARSDASPVRIGSIDSGVRATHDALKDNFLGDHGWYDPVEETAEPNDQNGHGTHTLGTICGANGIGVAPQAKWLACKGCEKGRCAQSDILACGQFMMCPTKPDGTGEDCSKAPVVINNSWGGPGGDNFYKTMINSWHTAGIIPIFANGNDGPWCGTSGSPGDYSDVISVGATNVDDNLASFSSRGPAGGLLGIGGVTKPDLSAPGEQIFSAWHSGDNAYNTISGTSMAAPHVTGLVALMFTAKPHLTYDEVKAGLLSGCTTAALKRTLLTCEFQGFRFRFPNNEYGKGIINVPNSVRHVMNLKASSV